MTENHSQTKRWVRITQAEDIPLREGRSIQIAGHEIAIFNLGERFLAVVVTVVILIVLTVLGSLERRHNAGDEDS